MSSRIGGSAKPCADSSHEFLIVKRFRNVIVGPTGEPLGDVADGVFCGEKNDGDVPSAFILLHQGTSIVATENGKHDIQKNEVRILVSSDFHTDDGILGSQNVEVLTEHGLKKSSRFRIIFNDEQSRFFHDVFFARCRLSGSFLGLGKDVFFCDFLFEAAPRGVGLEEDFD